MKRDHPARESATHQSAANGLSVLAWEAAMVQLRDHTEPVNARLGDTPHPEGRRRPRDRDRDRGNYERRPSRAANHAQPLTADSTALPAGTPSIPFKRADSFEQQEGVGSRPVSEDGNGPRRIEALDAERAPKRPRKKSRYEALPPGDAPIPAEPEDLDAATPEGQPDAVASQFGALRAALLAEARQSARGGKR